VSLWLVEQGWARVYEAYPTSESDDARALPAARAAPYALLAVVAASR
jgi:endonuclease YncB( thermonuclease family)